MNENHNILSKEPMEYTFNHSAKTLSDALEHITDEADNKLLRVFLEAIYDMNKDTKGMFGYIVASLAGEDFTKPSQLAEYLLHSLTAIKVSNIITTGMVRTLEIQDPAKADELKDLLAGITDDSSNTAA